MAAKGAKYKWHEGKILHASYLWKAPSKRRIPRILIEDRALEVGIKISLAEPWMIFEETMQVSSNIDTNNAIPLEFYFSRYHLLPAKIKNQDTYDWLLKPENCLLLWAKGGKYYVKPDLNG